MKNKIKKLFIQGFTAILAVVLISLFSMTNAQAQNTKGEMVMATATVTATVTKIDHKSREVHIKTDDKQEYKFIAGADVQNLDQVKKGDVITVVYTEALAYEVKAHSTTGVSSKGAIASTAQGEKPAGAMAQQTTETVMITAIDTKAPSVTVKDSDGELQTIKVKDPTKLIGLKVGDTVDITYTEAFAISVDPKVKK
jgi:Cu/Ag efflux protein CusF